MNVSPQQLSDTVVSQAMDIVGLKSHVWQLNQQLQALQAKLDGAQADAKTMTNTLVQFAEERDKARAELETVNKALKAVEALP